MQAGRSLWLDALLNAKLFRFRVAKYNFCASSSTYTHTPSIYFNEYYIKAPSIWEWNGHRSIWKKNFSRMFSTKKEKIIWNFSIPDEVKEVPHFTCNYGINLVGARSMEVMKWLTAQLCVYVDWALEANQWWFLEAFNNNNSPVW